MRKLYFLLLVFIGFYACSSDNSSDGPVKPDVDPPLFVSDTTSSYISREGAEQSIETNFSMDDEVSYTASNWFKLTKVDNNGHLKIVVKFAENISSALRSKEVVLKSKNKASYFFFNQRALIEIQTPRNNADYVRRRNIPFKWNCDIDSTVTYRLDYKEENNQWNTIDHITRPDTTISNLLKAKTIYEWKITGYRDTIELASSEVNRFTTGNKIYDDGEVLTLEKNQDENILNFILLADGFVEEDYEPGGAFDKATQRAIYGLFKAEPYASYRKYFNVYTVVAFSNQRGVTIQNGDKKSTVFKTYVHSGNTSLIEADYNIIQKYAEYVPNIANRKNTVIVLIPNLNRYCGSTVFNMGGQSPIAMCGYSDTPRSGTYWTKFENVVTHEACGHGFARLADEYLSGGSNFAKDMELLKSFKANNEFVNVDYRNDPTQVTWSQFIGKTGYDAVGVYEGAFCYSQQFYRSEKNSCMVNNTFYFNAVSREEIVKRIYKAFNKPYSLDEFIKNDKQKSEPTSAGQVD